MKKKLLIVFSIVCVLLTLYGCGAMDKVNTFISKVEPPVIH